MVFRSFQELYEAHKISATLIRVSPGSTTFYATATDSDLSVEAQREQIKAHCRNHGLHVHKWMVKNGQPTAVVSKDHTAGPKKSKRRS